MIQMNSLLLYHESPIFKLRVRRTHLVEDALRQLRAAERHEFHKDLVVC